MAAAFLVASTTQFAHQQMIPPFLWVKRRTTALGQVVCALLGRPLLDHDCGSLKDDELGQDQGLGLEERVRIG